MPHCCSTMKDAAESVWEKHQDRWACPDALISHVPKFDEYGIIVQGGSKNSCGLIVGPEAEGARSTPASLALNQER